MYVPLDVNFPDDPKIIAVGLDGAGLYASALCLAKRLLTDGLLTEAHLTRLGGTPDLVQRLLDAELLHRCDDGHLGITAWLVHNASADELDRRRSNDAARKRQTRRSTRRNRPDGHSADVQPDTTDTSERTTATRPPGVRAIEVEEERETDSQSSDTTTAGASTGSDDDPVGAAISILADGDLARRQSEKGPVGNPTAWLGAARAARTRDHANALRALHRDHPDWSPPVLASAVLETEQPDTPTDATVAAQTAAMERNARRANGQACQVCHDTGWAPDDIGAGVHPCTCPLGAFAG